MLCPTSSLFNLRLPTAAKKLTPVIPLMCAGDKFEYVCVYLCVSICTSMLARSHTSKREGGRGRNGEGPGKKNLLDELLTTN